jgi:hypothetical protein
LWQLNEIYSNADGTVQFIELITGASRQQFLTGHAASVFTRNVTCRGN